MSAKDSLSPVRKGNKCTEILLLIWIINQRNGYQSISLITNHLPHILILFPFTEHVSSDRTAQMRMMKCDYLKFIFGRHCGGDDHDLDVLMRVIYIFTF